MASLNPPAVPSVASEELHLPAALLGEAHVHAGDFLGEEGRLVAAGAGADFQDGVAVVVGIVGQQGGLEVGLGLGQGGFQLPAAPP